MAAANSTGGCMGKIIAISSIVIAVAATGWTGSEGKILRFVFPAGDLLGRPGRPAGDAAGLCHSLDRADLAGHVTSSAFA